MSWRRFQVLVKGLSPASATVSRLNADRFIGGKRSNVKVAATPEAAETAFEAAFKPAPKRRKKA